MFSLLIRRDGLMDPPAMTETDHHCHILAGIDDGPEGDSGSLAMASLLSRMGVRRIVATPHVISDLYPNTTEQILAATDALRLLLSESGLEIEITPGAEYYAEAELLRRLNRGDLLAFGPERYVLFESPADQQPMILEEIAFSLVSEGYTPLLAHAERYRYLQRDRGFVDHLRDMGVKFQVNHPSFHLPRTSRRGEMARWLYLRGLVEVMGTDMHRAATRADGRHPSETSPNARSTGRVWFTGR